MKNEGSGKGPDLENEIEEGAARDLHTEDAPDLQGDTYPHLLPLLD